MHLVTVLPLDARLQYSISQLRKFSPEMHNCVLAQFFFCCSCAKILDCKATNVNVSSLEHEYCGLRGYLLFLDVCMFVAPSSFQPETPTQLTPVADGTPPRGKTPDG